jgi:GntR family transcriptional regulator
MASNERRPRVSHGAPLLPRHHTAYLVLRQRLEAMAPDALLPGEHELAADLGVSRITLRRALGRLEDEGRIRRRRGDGTRAIRPVPQVTGTEDTVADLLRFGRGMLTEVLSLADVPADEVVAAAMRVAAGTALQRAEIRRVLEGTPISHLAAFVLRSPGTPALDRDLLATRPLLTLTEEIGGKVREVVQSITAVLADAPLSGVLQVEPGAPLLRVSRCFIGRRGPVQFSVAHYRADFVAVETSERQSESRLRSEARISLTRHDPAQQPSAAEGQGTPRRAGRPGDRNGP